MIYNSDGSNANVQSLIDGAVDGDTITIPAGTFSWTTTVAITKAIILQGLTTTDSVAGTSNDQTIILDDVPRTTPNNGIIIQVTGASARITGITFKAGGITTVGGSGAIQVKGVITTTGFRVDTCNFFDGLYQSINIWVLGWTYGVIDHNVMKWSTNRTAESVLFWNGQTWGGGSNSFGDGSFADDRLAGTSQAVFMEDNYFQNFTTTQTIGNTDSQHGGRQVFRYNHCYNVTPNTHGTEARLRGSRTLEVYNNDFHYTFQANMGQLRGGTMLWHDNTWDGTQPSSGMVLEAYRAFDSNTPWAGASGNNPWDVNDGHGLYLSGTHTGANGATTLTVAGAGWTTDQWKGYTVSNTDVIRSGQINGRHPCAIITGNTATVITYIVWSDYNLVFNTGQNFAIYKVLVILDQPGRGKCDLIAGETNPLNTTTGTEAWPNQLLEPCYSWNNFYTGNVAVNLAPSENFNPGIYTSGTDYYNGTPMPGYTPYTYPHPLVNTTIGCTVPDFIGRKIRVAVSLWTDAGFSAENITLEGNPGDTIKTQSLPAGSTGQCSSAVITVSRRRPTSPPNPVDPGQISGISTTTGHVDVNYKRPGVKVKHTPPVFSTNPARRTLGFFYLWPAYSDAGHQPDFSQCNGLTNPYMSGILLRETWALIEPNLDGNYDWSYLDGCVAACISAGKLFSFQHLAGFNSPTPLFSQPNVNFIDMTDVGDTAINWDPVTQTHWQALHVAMANRYKNNKHMGYVVMSLIGRASESFLTNNTDPEDYVEATNLAISMGYDTAEDAWIAGTKWNIDMMIAAWSPVPIVFTTGVPFPTDAAIAAQLEVINYGNNTYRGKFGVRRNDLSHGGPPDNMYVSITSPYCKASGYQPTQTQRNNDPNPPTWFGQMVTRGTNYLSNKKGIIEVFPGDVDPWNTEPATETILATANWSS